MIDNFIRNMKDKMDISLAKAEIIKKNESSYTGKHSNRRVPYLSLYTLGDSYDRIIGYPERMGLVSEDARRDIYFIWMNSIDPNDIHINEYFDPDMYIGVMRYEMECYWDYAINMKEEVKQVILQTLGIAPRKIYSSSAPSVNIVFETEDYNQHIVSAYEDTIRQKIRRLAKKYVDEKYGGAGLDIDCILNVNFWHPEMPNYNGYFLARQD